MLMGHGTERVILLCEIRMCVGRSRAGKLSAILADASEDAANP